MVLAEELRSGGVVVEAEPVARSLEVRRRGEGPQAAASWGKLAVSSAVPAKL
jgi:hypothetical protein